jgi:hypothetical protein
MTTPTLQVKEWQWFQVRFSTSSFPKYLKVYGVTEYWIVYKVTDELYGSLWHCNEEFISRTELPHKRHSLYPIEKVKDSIFIIAKDYLHKKRLAFASFISLIITSWKTKA